MSDLKRYTIRRAELTGIRVSADPKGEWVKYSDVELLMEVYIAGIRMRQIASAASDFPKLMYNFDRALMAIKNIMDKP